METIIYFGLLSIFLLVLTDLFVTLLELHTESTATSAVVQDSRFILARLEYDVTRASSIITPANLGATSGALSVLIGGVTTTYALSDGNFQLTNNWGTDNLNSSETTITSSSFQRLGNSGGKDTIKLYLLINSLTPAGAAPETRTLQTTIGRR